MLKYLWRQQRDDRGFTLIELLIVVAIIAILAAILIPNFLRARAQSQVAASKGNLKNMGTALESYFVDWNNYPATLALLTASPQYIRSIPPDPCTKLAYGYNTTGTDYGLYSPTWVGTPCANIVTGNAIYYTPGGGLAEGTP
jgi:prepilin-type N-terminal cleavage/methylation domain-containing protein